MKTLKYFLFVLTFYICPFNFFSQKLDSILTTSQPDSVKLNILLQVSEECEPADILKYTKPALELTDKLLNRNPALSANQKKEILHKKAHALSNIAFYYNMFGDVPKSLFYYDKALKIQEEIKDKEGTARSLNDIGGVYNNQADVSNALIYYQKGLKIREAINDKQGIAQSLINIGSIYQEYDLPKALECYTKSLKIHEEIGDVLGVAHSLNNLGLANKIAGNLNEAINYYERSLKILSKIGNKEGLAFSFNNIAAIYFNQKKYTQAKKYSDSSLIISKNLGIPENIKYAEVALSKIDSAMGNFVGAFEHYKQSIIFRDSILNEGNRRASIKSQLKYEFEKKEAVMKEQQDKERAIANEKDRFQQIVIWSVITGFLLVLVFVVFIFRTLKTTRLQKAIIEEKQKEILDSIHYAKRIQRSLLPSEKYIQRNVTKLLSDNK